MKRDLVQVRNPRTNRYVKIDRAKGIIIGEKKTAGPYKNVPIARRRLAGEGIVTSQPIVRMNPAVKKSIVRKSERAVWAVIAAKKAGATKR